MYFGFFIIQDAFEYKSLVNFGEINIRLVILFPPNQLIVIDIQSIAVVV